MDMVQRLLMEAQEELGIDKIANDLNGAPDQPQQQGGQDILQVANDFVAKVQQFKSQIAGQVVGQDDPGAEGEIIEGAVDENGQPVNAEQPPQASGGATIQTPGGTVIKLAGLVKMASTNFKMREA